MLTLQEVEHSIHRFGTVELGELSFPFGQDYEQVADWLEHVANQIGTVVQRGTHQGHRMLLVYPHGEPGFWQLVWRDGEIEIIRFYPERQTFSYNRPAAVDA